MNKILLLVVAVLLLSSASMTYGVDQVQSLDVGFQRSGHTCF